MSTLQGHQNELGKAIKNSVNFAENISISILDMPATVRHTLNQDGRTFTDTAYPRELFLVFHPTNEEFVDAFRKEVKEKLGITFPSKSDRRFAASNMDEAIVIPCSEDQLVKLYNHYTPGLLSQKPTQRESLTNTRHTF